jgi:hypothetical protein
MHVPSHSGTLPAGVDPIPVPDLRREAEMLVLLLDAGLYPRIQFSPRATGTEGDSRKSEVLNGRVDRVAGE